MLDVGVDRMCVQRGGACSGKRVHRKVTSLSDKYSQLLPHIIIH